MGNERDDEEIDLLEMAAYLLHWWWVIIISGMITAAVALSITLFAMTPMYQSTTKIYILSKQNNSTVTTSDMQLGTQLVKDYREMIKSRYVLETVIEQCGLDDTYESLSARVSVTIPTDTRMIAITVSDPSPNKAKEIVDAIRVVAGEHIVQVMDLQAVNVVDQGNVPENPSSPSKKKNVIIGFAAGLFLSIVVFVVIYLLDDTIKTSDDIEKYLELSTLASIPLIEDEKNGKKSKGKKKKVARGGK